MLDSPIKTLLVAFALLVPAQSAQAADRYMAPESSCPVADMANQTQEMGCLINYARSVKGLRPVKENQALGKSALIKSNWIFKAGDFTHTPFGRTLASGFRQGGYLKQVSSYTIGENLAWGSDADIPAREIFQGWLDSPEHKENILAAQWKEYGLSRTNGSLLDADDSTLWVSTFGAVTRRK